VDSGIIGPVINGFGFLQQADPTGFMVIGDQGTGHLVVRNVGVVDVQGTLVVGRAGAGDVTITDPSSIVHAENLTVGANGTVSVSNGGKLATSEHQVGRTIINTGGKITLTN